MNKLALILFGCFLFLSGLLAGSLFDRNQVLAESEQGTQYGYIYLSAGTYEVHWFGGRIQVEAPRELKLAVAFTYNWEYGKLNFSNLRPK